jgi:hypothetical protein
MCQLDRNNSNFAVYVLGGRGARCPVCRRPLEADLARRLVAISSGVAQFRAHKFSDFIRFHRAHPLIKAFTASMTSAHASGKMWL